MRRSNLNYTRYLYCLPHFDHDFTFSFLPLCYMHALMYGSLPVELPLAGHVLLLTIFLQCCVLKIIVMFKNLFITGIVMNLTNLHINYNLTRDGKL